MSDLIIEKKKPISRDAIMSWLVDAGYQRVYMVMEPGEFAVRGSIVDIFSFNHSTPVRCDYFGDDLERLNSFDPRTQRSLSNLNQTTCYDHSYASTTYAHAYFSDHELDLMLPFEEDDYVVHETHGVGRFRGLIRMTIAQREGEYVQIDYKDKDKLFVPIEQLHLLHKFTEGEGSPRLNKLYDGSWKRIKERTKKALSELVDSIYQTMQKRQTIQGFAFSEDSEQQLVFEKRFPYKETPDQDLAIRDVKSDMEKTLPMDRLLCGDVGFGKTEVMLRAAFKAVDNLKQVAILVPTTILAEQHYKTFKERFEGFQCRIASLSSFKSKKEQNAILSQLKDHQLDVVIGTHRLLQKDVSFSDLGLLIVDEEQRFGVSHKEKVKRLVKRLMSYLCLQLQFQGLCIWL